MRAEEKIRKKWNIMNMIDTLAEGNILKYEEVVRLPILFCFTFLLYKKETKEG